MSLEHALVRSPPEGATKPHLGTLGPPEASNYWYGLIDERAIADFNGLSVRTIRSLRQTGQGPAYILISNRCIRYRRIDSKSWQDARLRRSTSEVA